jgi:hypothetical protein
MFTPCEGIEDRHSKVLFLLKTDQECQ